MSEEPSRPPWKNPFLIMFVVGAVLVTLVSPLFRKVAPPPEVTGRMSPFSLVDQQGRALTLTGLSGRVALIGLVTERSPDASRSVAAAFATLEPRFATARADVALILVDLDARDPVALGAWLAREQPPGAAWQVLAGEQACTVARVAFGVFGATDCEGAFTVAREGRLALLDAAGELRGVHGTSPETLYETFERTLRACDLAGR